MSVLCFINPQSGSINSQRIKKSYSLKKSFFHCGESRPYACGILQGLPILPRGRMENLAPAGLDCPQRHKPHILPRGADFFVIL